MEWRALAGTTSCLLTRVPVGGGHTMCTEGAGGYCAPLDSTRLARPWMFRYACWLDRRHAVQPHFSA
eukprot:356106-Chlamydomonas_euryale.AAC.7